MISNHWLIVLLLGTTTICLRYLTLAQREHISLATTVDDWKYRSYYLLSKTIYLASFTIILVLASTHPMCIWEAFLLFPALIISVTLIEYYMHLGQQIFLWRIYYMEILVFLLLCISCLIRYPTLVPLHLLNYLTLVHLTVAERRLILYYTTQLTLKQVDLTQLLVPEYAIE
jgi:hypothetical protein